MMAKFLSTKRSGFRSKTIKKNRTKGLGVNWIVEKIYYLINRIKIANAMKTHYNFKY